MLPSLTFRYRMFKQCQNCKKSYGTTCHLHVSYYIILCFGVKGEPPCQNLRNVYVNFNLLRKSNLVQFSMFNSYLVYSKIITLLRVIQSLWNVCLCKDNANFLPIFFEHNKKLIMLHFKNVTFVVHLVSKYNLNCCQLFECKNDCVSFSC